MNRLIKGLGKFVFKWRAVIIIAVAVLTVFFSFQLITKIKVNSDILSYLPDTDRAVKLFNEIGDRFGSNQIALIVVQADDVFAPEVIKHVDEITRAVKGLDCISSVISVTDVIDIKKSEDGSLEIGKLIDMTSNPSEGQLKTAGLYASTKKLYTGSLISADRKATLVSCFIKKDVDKDKAARLIRKTVKDLNTGEKLFFGGLPFMLSGISDLIYSDLILLVPIVALLISLTLYVSFGTLRGVIIPLVSVFISNVWVMGLMSMLGVPLTIISDIMPVLLIAIGTAPSIHIISKFDESPELRYGNTGDEAAAAFSEVGLRVILTSLTIIFGFTSFIFGSYLTMIRDFGIFMSIGIFFSLVISMMFVPALLTYIKVKPGKVKEIKVQKAGHMFLEGMGAFVMKNKRILLVMTFIAAIAGMCGTPFIKRGFDLVGFFPKKHEVRAADSVIQKNFGGSNVVQVVFRGDIQSPAVLYRMRKTEKFLDSLKGISNSQSVAALITEMDDIMEGGKKIPDSRDKIVNLWFLLDGQDVMSNFVSSDLQTGLVQAVAGKNDPKELVKAIESYLGGMEKEYTRVNRDETRNADEMVKKYLVREAASVTALDILKRDIDTPLVPERLEEIIAPMAAGGTINSNLAAEKIAAMIPEEKRDRFIERDIADNLMMINDRNAYLPASLYAKLPDGKSGENETVKFTVEYTGTPFIFSNLDNSLINSQVESLIYALIFIFAVFALQLKSIRFGFIGLVPIVFNIIIMFGIMGYFAIPLDVATVLTGSIALGIGIDFAIHFLMRFKDYYIKKDSVEEAVMETMRTTGKAIVINVVVVTVGFMTLFFAHLVPVQRFGLLIAAAMIGSGVGTLTILPALLASLNLGFLGKKLKKGGSK